MKLTKRLESASWVIKLVDLGLNLNCFEVQREMGRLKSASIAKEKVGFWRFLETESLRDGCDELEEHMDMDMEGVGH